MKGRVLIIAGSDSGGGAGIQADIKTATALGAYAATALTALTAQNTEGVQGILPVAPAFVKQQIASVLDDIGADCIKTGMLLDHGVIEAAADAIERGAPGVPLVVDPVMVASTGARLLDTRAFDALERRLIARATLVTPNAPEAEALTGGRVADLDGMRRAAEALLRAGAKAAMVKGGHIAGEMVRDLVVTAAGDSFVLEARRIATRSTHGTGCTLASAIAAGLAQGMALRQAIERAHRFVQEAIRTAPGLGRGHGPLNHSWAIER
ncbi:MAG TPA: bifunctional hydroxymethylpyrimidine kinase/phosphomethylpyrimidine kinase [Stellaceae bacterium]|nr:bifunctional hydroxymethylpyrimidine kinase/phosphomethylpyrimidine kinase [Stellaceae bacterium]